MPGGIQKDWAAFDALARLPRVLTFFYSPANFPSILPVDGCLHTPPRHIFVLFAAAPAAPPVPLSQRQAKAAARAKAAAARFAFAPDIKPGSSKSSMDRAIKPGKVGSGSGGEGLANCRGGGLSCKLEVSTDGWLSPRDPLLSCRRPPRRGGLSGALPSGIYLTPSRRHAQAAWSANGVVRKSRRSSLPSGIGPVPPSRLRAEASKVCKRERPCVLAQAPLLHSFSRHARCTRSPDRHAVSPGRGRC